MTNKDIAPDEIFMDSKNLPDFDISQFEGRIEKPINRIVHFIFATTTILVAILFLAKLWQLQIIDGQSYKERSENNKLKQSILFAPRGIIYDRNGERLAFNQSTTSSEVVPERNYSSQEGLSMVLGFLKYPAKDASGFFYEEEFTPKDGAELYFNESLSGRNGLRLFEVSVENELISESVVSLPRGGMDITLSIDSRIQSELYKNMRELSSNVGFQGGAGVILAVHSGDILTLVSFP